MVKQSRAMSLLQYLIPSMNNFFLENQKIYRDFLGIPEKHEALPEILGLESVHELLIHRRVRGSHLGSPPEGR